MTPLRKRMLEEYSFATMPTLRLNAIWTWSGSSPSSSTKARTS